MMNRKVLTGALSLALLAAGDASVSRADITDAQFSKAMENYISKDENIEKIATAFERYAAVRQQMEAKKAAEAQKKEMEEQLKNPIKIDIGSSPVKGNPNAKNVIFEFSDFQCPFCKRGMETMEEVLKAYPNDVKLVFKQLPLAFHENARPAAKASIAAGKQGKFWEMYELLFKNQQELSEKSYEKYAQNLGLDMAKFKADSESAETEAAVAADEKLAASLKINGTPAFVVNGVMVSGARPIPYFKDILEKTKK